jgi:hypothetical protein
VFAVTNEYPNFVYMLGVLYTAKVKKNFVQKSCLSIFRPAFFVTQKLSLCLTNEHYVMKEDVRVFLTSALVGGEWSASRPGRFTPEERTSGIHWIGGWVALTAGPADLEKRKFFTLTGLEFRPLQRSTCSQS